MGSSTPTNPASCCDIGPAALITAGVEIRPPDLNIALETPPPDHRRPGYNRRAGHHRRPNHDRCRGGAGTGRCRNCDRVGYRTRITRSLCR